MEVDRPNRQARHRQGKSDPVDAVAASRAAFSCTVSNPGESFYTAADVINYLFGNEQQGHKGGDQLLAGSI